MVRVKFWGCRISVFESGDEPLQVGDYCIFPFNDDLELGQVIGKFKIQKTSRPIQKIIRKATQEDRKQFEEITFKSREAHEICLKKIKSRNLPMKLIMSRYSFDGSKIMFYFTSDKRVDFRDLVKDLAHIFKRRIELRQIGVRDEAKMIGGYGCCGLQLCCTTFLKKLGRLSIRMAKEQDMTLSPSKISGICGRLLCCLQFENEWYQEMKKIMPRIGDVVRTESLSGKVEDLDLFRCIVKVRDDNGRLIEVNLKDIQKEEEPKTNDE